jgi:hypothetical protein
VRQEGPVFFMDFALAGDILPETVQFTILCTKVEIQAFKMNPGRWAVIEESKQTEGSYLISISFIY